MTRAAVVVVGSLLVVVGGIALIEREATRLWFTDPVSGEEGQKEESDPAATTSKETRTALADATAPVRIPRGISQPTRRVAQWSILRTRRDPRRLNFLLLPVVIVGSALFSSGMQAESPLAVFVPAAAVLLPWMAGATFAMNPFGDEGSVLPITLISISGLAYVRGVMLPGLLLRLPIAVLVTGGAALVGPFELPAAVGLVGVALLATVVAVSTAPAVGIWFPRFSAISIGQSREVVPPRLVTTAFHFLGVTVPATLLQLVAGEDVGVLSDASTWFYGIGTAVQSVSGESFQLVGGGLLVVGAVVITVLSYRLAVRRFDRYSPSL
ncbi:hypothetical protein [Halostella sp. PRR32]|uniref:hypothetical protein n=1 Tax=Halostella sp. PRR32 TaxID=3098147 RepID=UPI002B1E06F7|nr:hypothetical protein [Halostella sp. PRR32]